METLSIAAGQSLQPESFRPMCSSEVARYVKVSIRTLEEWRRRTKDTGELVGPPFAQDYEGGKVLYPEICVKRFAMARAVGCPLAEATRFAWQPLSDLSSTYDLSLPDYQPRDRQAPRQNRRT